MKKFLLFLVLLLGLPVFAGGSQEIVVACAPGYLSGTPPVTGLPEYDYQPNGLVEFHFHSTSDWNYNIMVYRAYYTGSCDFYATAAGSGVAWPNNFPAGVRNFSMRFTKFDNGSYNFVVFNDDTNEEIPNGVGSMPGNGGEFEATHLSLSIGFYTYSGYPGYPTYTETGVFTDAVPLKNPNLQPQKTPVLIVPGIMGSVIKKDSELLWPDITRMLNPFASDAFMDPLAFKSDGSPIDTSLSLGEVISLAGPLDYSKQLVTDLVSFGYSTSSNLTLFAYDWRADDENNAENFLKPLVDTLSAGSPTSKIDIVAHSQGGLLVKRLLYNHPEYAAKIGKLVFVGTPNLGAPVAAKILLYGDNMGVSFGPLQLNPQEVKKISQNMPAVYELLPSREYFNHTAGYLGNLDSSISLIGGVNYNFSQTSQALRNLGANASLLARAQVFHAPDFDNMDFSGAGFKTYNIAGCQSATVGQVLMSSDGKYHLNYTAGDGTVPIISADNVGGAQNYFVLSSDKLHATMLTADGIRQTIENILTGSGSMAGNVTKDKASCRFEGRQVSVHSPVDLQIYDEHGKYVGPNADGTFNDDLAGVKYDVIGHDKFAFLPAGHDYTIKLLSTATSSDSFSLDSSQVQNGQTVSTAHYDSVAVNPGSIATMVLSGGNNQNLQLDIDGDGNVDQNISPSAILNSGQSQDLLPPVSTSTLSGLAGQSGYYRSDVKVAISSLDPVIPGQDSQTAGLLKTVYSLDGADFQNYSAPVVVAAEGVHTLQFYAVDKAGNRESVQTASFTIDKTPPELVAQFSPDLQDLQWTATDTLPTVMAATSSKATAEFRRRFLPPIFPPLKVADKNSTISATDAAGNVTEIKLKDADRKRQLKAEIKSLSYNGKAADLSKNLLHFDWLYDKKGKLQILTQQVQARNQFNILAVYGLGKTLLTGKDQSGKFSRLLNGLVLLKVATSKGDLNWSY